MVDIALIGAGRIGKIHGGNLARQAGMRLRYVGDAVPKAASEPAARLGAGVATLNQVFSDGAVQAVAIASSTDTHAELILRAAAARKAIFCEKPVDLDLGRAREVQAAVATARVSCLIGFQRRYDPTSPPSNAGPTPAGSVRSGPFPLTSATPPRRPSRT